MMVSPFLTSGRLVSASNPTVCTLAKKGAVLRFCASCGSKKGTLGTGSPTYMESSTQQARVVCKAKEESTVQSCRPSI